MGNFLLVVLGFFLFATNPEQAEFDQFVRTTVSGKVQSGNALVDMFAGGLVSGLAKENTFRKNYYFFFGLYLGLVSVGDAWTKCSQAG